MPLPSIGLIQNEIIVQTSARDKSRLAPTNLLIQGEGTQAVVATKNTIQMLDAAIGKVAPRRRPFWRWTRGQSKRCPHRWWRRKDPRLRWPLFLYNPARPAVRRLTKAPSPLLKPQRRYCRRSIEPRAFTGDNCHARIIGSSCAGACGRRFHTVPKPQND